MRHAARRQASGPRGRGNNFVSRCIGLPGEFVMRCVIPTTGPAWSARASAGWIGIRSSLIVPLRALSWATCPKRPAMFELGDLRFRPSMIGSEPIWFETREWIVCAYAGVDRVGYHLRKDRACQVRHARARGADVLDDVPRNPVSFLQGPSLCTSAPFMAKRQTL
jgi:hypothetical protein